MNIKADKTFLAVLDDYENRLKKNFKMFLKHTYFL